MIKLTVVLATLLLLTGVAFATGDCSLYEFHYTWLDDPEISGTWCVELCFYSGYYYGFCDLTTGDLELFFDSMKKQALFSNNYDVNGYLKFHGDNLFSFTGIEDCDGYRYEIRGHKVEECVIPK
jgi:hypothetical protein